MEQLQQKLKEIRQEQNASQYYLSQFCELGGNSAYKRIEDNGNPQLLTLIKLTKHLKFKITIDNGEIIIT